MAVQILFTLVLIILAKGWAITTQALTGKKIMFGLFGAIICCYLALYIWGGFFLCFCNTVIPDRGWL